MLRAMLQDSTAQHVPGASDHFFFFFSRLRRWSHGAPIFFFATCFCCSIRGALGTQRWTPNFKRAELTENESTKPCPCIMSLNRGIGL